MVEVAWTTVHERSRIPGIRILGCGLGLGRLLATGLSKVYEDFQADALHLQKKGRRSIRKCCGVVKLVPRCVHLREQTCLQRLSNSLRSAGVNFRKGTWYAGKGGVQRGCYCAAAGSELGFLSLGSGFGVHSTLGLELSRRQGRPPVTTPLVDGGSLARSDGQPWPVWA